MLHVTIGTSQCHNERHEGAPNRPTSRIFQFLRNLNEKSHHTWYAPNRIGRLDNGHFQRTTIQKGRIMPVTLTAKELLEDGNLQEYLSSKENRPMMWFIEQKVKAMTSEEMKPEVVRRWTYQLLAKWSGPALFAEVSKNQRKMEIVHKIWKTSFFGYGLECPPPKEVLHSFRRALRAELAVHNAKVSLSRQKYNEKTGRASPPKYPEQPHYFTLEAAKLSNERTLKKNILPRRPLSDSTPTPAPNGRRVSYDEAYEVRKFHEVDAPMSINYRTFI